MLVELHTTYCILQVFTLAFSSGKYLGLCSEASLQQCSKGNYVCNRDLCSNMPLAMSYNAAPVNCAVNHCARSYSTWFCHMHHEQMERVC